MKLARLFVERSISAATIANGRTLIERISRSTSLKKLSCKMRLSDTEVATKAFSDRFFELFVSDCVEKLTSSIEQTHGLL